MHVRLVSRTYLLPGHGVVAPLTLDDQVPRVGRDVLHRPSDTRACSLSTTPYLGTRGR